MNAKKILVLDSSTRARGLAFELLLELHEKADFHLLTNRPVKDESISNMLTKIFNTGSDKFIPELIPAHLLEQLQANDYQYGYFLLNDITRQPCINLFDLMRTLKLRRLRYIDAKNRWGTIFPQWFPVLLAHRWIKWFLPQASDTNGER